MGLEYGREWINKGKGMIAMQRIMVVGASAGAGKSTFARQLSEKLHIPVHHLDTMYWKPDWIEEDKAIFIEKQQEIVQTHSWIIEGNYSSTFEGRVNRADTMIYIDQPLLICLYRVVKRRFMYHGKSRPDLTKGCREQLDPGFLWYILKTYYPRKRAMKNRLAEFELKRKQNRVHILTGTKEIKHFLEQLN